MRQLAENVLPLPAFPIAIPGRSNSLNVRKPRSMNPIRDQASEICDDCAGIRARYDCLRYAGAVVSE